jgi:hypothetical protein
LERLGKKRNYKNFYKKDLRLRSRTISGFLKLFDRYIYRQQFLWKTVNYFTHKIEHGRVLNRIKICAIVTKKHWVGNP